MPSLARLKKIMMIVATGAWFITAIVLVETIDHGYVPAFTLGGLIIATGATILFALLYVMASSQRAESKAGPSGSAFMTGLATCTWVATAILVAESIDNGLLPAFAVGGLVIATGATIVRTLIWAGGQRARAAADPSATDTVLSREIHLPRPRAARGSAAVPGRHGMPMPRQVHIPRPRGMQSTTVPAEGGLAVPRQRVAPSQDDVDTRELNVPVDPELIGKLYRLTNAVGRQADQQDSRNGLHVVR